MTSVRALGLKLSFLGRRFALRPFISPSSTSSSYLYSSPEEIKVGSHFFHPQRTHLEEDHRSRSPPCSAEASRPKEALGSFQPQEAADFQLRYPCSTSGAYPEQPNSGRSNPPSTGPRGWPSSKQRRSPLHSTGSESWLPEPEPRDSGSTGLCHSNPQNN